jgi:quercetin dioxygenase-like cupin family protein
MQTRFKLALLVAIVGVAAFVAGTALATPGSGVSSTTLGQASLDPIKTKAKAGDWEIEIETKGQSNVTVVENRVAPGGHFGWHSHPGPSLVLVKSGTSTFYRGDDPTCTPQVYPAGSAYVDPGGTVHIARNEGTVELVLIVTRIIPEGAPARIDQPNPGNCPF